MPPPATPAEQDQDELDGQPDDAIEAPASPASTTLSVADVRASPEYREQRNAARREARKAGTAAAEIGRLRAELEATRTAAEAQARESQAAEVRNILGDEGVAAWDEIAELSATDPVAAARQFAEFSQRMAQSQAAGAPAPEPAQAPPVAAGGTIVPPAPLPGMGVSASAPLGQPTTDNSWEQIADEAEARYQEVVKTMQGPLSGRNRVTGRIRTGAIMDFLTSSIARAVGERERNSGARR